MLKYISLFSGIEAATVAWRSLGWQAIAFSEINKDACKILSRHYPDVPNHGDITQFDWSIYQDQVNMVVGGSPCQAFSVAGLRQGLNDDRGNLTLEYVRTINTIRPQFFFWENVLGVLSDKTNAFGCLLSGLLDAQVLPAPQRGRWNNHGLIVGNHRAIAWRVLNARNFGVPQNRRRVFLFGFDFRAGARLFPPSSTPIKKRLGGLPAAILFEPEAERKYSATDSITQCLCPSLSSQCSPILAFNTIDRGFSISRNISPTLTCGGNGRTGGGKTITVLLPCGDLRQLTPVECERLQGFPDDYTYGISKTARYKVLGNSFPVPVVRWIGQRLQAFLKNILKNA